MPRVIAVLTHPNSPDAREELHNLQDAANSKGQQLLVLTASSDREFEGSLPLDRKLPCCCAPCSGGPILFSE